MPPFETPTTLLYGTQLLIPLPNLFWAVNIAFHSKFAWVETFGSRDHGFEHCLGHGYPCHTFGIYIWEDDRSSFANSYCDAG